MLTSMTSNGCVTNSKAGLNYKKDVQEIIKMFFLQ